MTAEISIHALLAESDFDELVLPEGMDISIHALLAESDFSVSVDSFISVIFLSTLSLRRATSPDGRRICNRPYFYPRSPCGERLAPCQSWHGVFLISIHALLAESDFLTSLCCRMAWTFLSTLSLRRATARGRDRAPDGAISIHALLAESDQMQAFGCWLL